MTLSIMQPYFLPYIGYWQLMQAADTFVIYDDVAFINKGWINRNNMLANQAESIFTIPLIGASQNKKINEINIDWQSNWDKKLIKSIQQNYSKSISYHIFFPVLETILAHKTENIADFIAFSFDKMIEYLDINVTILRSERYQNSDLKAQERIIDICVQEKAKKYINAIGGQSLYDAQSFKQKDIDLKFMQTQLLPYPQKSTTFKPYLSILDLCMNVEQNDLITHLNAYELV
jgi:WbqC-like protein family